MEVLFTFLGERYERRSADTDSATATAMATDTD